MRAIASRIAQFVAMRAAPDLGLHRRVRALPGCCFDGSDDAIGGLDAVQRRVHAVEAPVQRHEHFRHVVEQLLGAPLREIDALARVGRQAGFVGLAELFAEEHHDRLGVLALPGRHVALAFGLAPLLLGHASDAVTIATSASVASATPILCRPTKRLAR